MRSLVAGTAVFTTGATAGLAGCCVMRRISAARSLAGATVSPTGNTGSGATGAVATGAGAATGATTGADAGTGSGMGSGTGSGAATGSGVLATLTSTGGTGGRFQYTQPRAMAAAVRPAAPPKTSARETPRSRSGTERMPAASPRPSGVPRASRSCNILLIRLIYRLIFVIGSIRSSSRRRRRPARRCRPATAMAVARSGAACWPGYRWRPAPRGVR